MGSNRLLLLPVLALVLVSVTVSHLHLVPSADAATTCADDPSFHFRWRNKRRSCSWLSAVTNSNRRTLLCNKKKQSHGRVKKHCRAACNFENCVSDENNENNNNNNSTCADNDTFGFVFKNRNRSCAWLSKVTNTNKKTTLCGDYQEFCQSACNYDNCLDGGNTTTTNNNHHHDDDDIHDSIAPTANPSAPPIRSPTASPTMTSALPSASPGAPPTDPSPPAFFSAKKGACWTLREEGKPGSYVEHLPKLRALNPYWAYSWAQKPAEGVPFVVAPDGRGIRIPNNNDDDNDNDNDDDDESSPPFIDYLPMLWGYWPKTFEQYTDDIRAQNPRVVLGFNEPDSAGQSDISVDDAIEGWSRLVDRVTEGRRDDDSDASDLLLVSPSPVNPLGEWFEAFMDGVEERGLRVDAIGIHWYANPNAELFAQRLHRVYETYNRPLLITEFAVADFKANSTETNKYSPEQVLAFMETVLPWIEEQDWILGYSWYSFKQTNRFGTSSALFAANNATTTNNNNDHDHDHSQPVLTPLGEYYAAFTGRDDESTVSLTPPFTNDQQLVGIGSSDFQHIDRGDYWLVRPQKRSRWASNVRAWDARSDGNHTTMR